MGRGIEIIIGGKVLPPEQAIKQLMPQDIRLRCPACNSFQVGAGYARTGVRIGGEDKSQIPRQQDRWCFECGYQWMVVLAPEYLTPMYAGDGR